MRSPISRWCLPVVAAAFLATSVHAQNEQSAQSREAPENPGSVKGDTQPSGMEPPHHNTGPTGDRTTSAPIGASGETTPAKFDPEVAARDRIPIMARPLALTDEQKQQIYDQVMNNDKIPVTHTSAEPATILPGSVELSDASPALNEQIPTMRGYKYVKLPDRVLVVDPPNRIVVGEIRR